MKYRPIFYARALKEALAGKSDSQATASLKKLVALVHKNGDGFYLNKIALEFEKVEIKARGGKVVTLEFARPALEDVIKQFSNEFDARDLIKTKLNPQLVAGVRININGEREMDNTIVRKLNKLFIS